MPRYGLVLAGGGAKGAYQIGAWKALREEAGITADASAIHGIVLHENLAISASDIPSCFLYKEGDSDVNASDADYDRVVGSLRDYEYIFTRMTKKGDHFDLHGNYFNVDAGALPIIVRENGKVMADDKVVVSHSALFRIECEGTREDCNETLASINNVNFLGNLKRENTSYTGGIILIKVDTQNMVLNNITARQWYITAFVQLSDNETCALKIKNNQYYDNYNSFVYIERDGSGKITALYPVSPTQVTFLEQRGELYVEMLFKNGYQYTLPYASFIHIRTHYGVNDLMGGDQFGQPDNKALLDTLELNKTLLDGVRKSLKSSFAINAIVKYNTMLDDGKIEAEIRDFEQKLQNSQSGILGVDNKAEVTQFERKLALVDEPTLKFIDEKILRHFGVPLEILRGDYTVEQYQAFYQKTLEPLIISYSEAFTKRLFTARERGYDNEVIFYPKELIFMSTQQTLEMVNLLGQSGALFENEKRVAFGLEPLAELRGVRKMSLNYVDVQIANAYQMGLEQNPSDTEEVVVDEDKTEA